MDFDRKLVKQVKTTLVHGITLGGRFLLNWPIKKDELSHTAKQSKRFALASGMNHTVPKGKKRKSRRT